MLNDVLTDEEKKADSIIIGKPIRIQRKRTKGWRMPPNTVYVGRGTLWGNPFKVGELIPGKQCTPGGYKVYYIVDNESAVEFFKRFLSLRLKIEAKHKLQGKNLACWCPLDQPCHADILLEIANG